jgi:hypothetical protein
MKALITTLSQISGPNTTDQSDAQGIAGSVAICQSNAHITTLSSGIVGSVAICQTNAHITTLSDFTGSVTTGKPMHISQRYQILQAL